MAGFLYYELVHSSLVTRRLVNQVSQALGILALLALALNACVSSRLEPFAPELKKRYVTTEALVITQSLVPPPLGIFLGNEGRDTTVVMTQEWFDRSNRSYSYSAPDMIQPYMDAVAKGSLVKVKQMFAHNTPSGGIRYAKVDIIDPKTEDTLNAYVVWEIVNSALAEVQ